MSLITHRMKAIPEDVTRFEDCFAVNDSPRLSGLVDWQYLQNPTGRIFVDFAVDEESGKTAGIYASMPHLAKIGKAQATVIQSVDTLTDKDFRGQGVFKALATSLFKEAANAQVPFIFGFPNGNSAPGFFGKLGWSQLDPVPFLLRPLNPTYFLKGRASLLPFKLPRIPAVPMAQKYTIKEVLLEDLPVDEIWKSFSESFQVGVVRDARYLAWRLRKPGQNYRIFGAFRGLEALGFVVINQMSKHGGSIGYVVELMTRNPATDLELAHELLNVAVNEFNHTQTDAILAWHFEHSPYYLAYLAAGFLPLPEKLRPIELHFGMGPLGFDKRYSRKDWYISYCDSDTV